MNETGLRDRRGRPAGYAALVAAYGLEIMPNWHVSAVGDGTTHRITTTAGVTEEVFPAKYWPGDSAGAQLEFALKYDGTNLGILAELFARMPSQNLLDHIRSRPTGKYARRLWFLYEFLTGTRLPLDDLQQGNYVDLLDPARYYTVDPPARRVRRHRINDNLLGENRFCPTIRRTDVLRTLEEANLTDRCRRIMSKYPPDLLKRALSYLYRKETRSSFEIEHLTAGSTRTERFIALLRSAEREDFVDKPRLIDLQNRIVDPRFAASDYRADQNYVGETVAWSGEKVHFVAPRPEDLAELMDGLIAAHRRMGEGGPPSVIHAAAIAYGFVFLHPFDDGNGRIHRFLIHHILARRGFTPEDFIFPISASMLRSPADYDDSLEAFSRPLMSLVDYSLDDEGRMAVRNDTARWYRFIDMTAQAEALFRFVERTVERDLVEELSFLANYDRTKRAIQDIVDMPDRMIDLFIGLCVRNNGKLSARKRGSHFRSLTEAEIARMEAAVQSGYGPADLMDG